MESNINIQSDNKISDKFIERLQEDADDDGYYDDRGFYCTPEGSFWDEDGDYFNRDGLDKHGGYYDEEDVYVPGPGWNPEFMCYEEDLKNVDEEIKQILLEDGAQALKENYYIHQKDYQNLDNEYVDDDQNEFEEERVEEMFKDFYEMHILNNNNMNIPSNQEDSKIINNNYNNNNFNNFK